LPDRNLGVQKVHFKKSVFYPLSQIQMPSPTPRDSNMEMVNPQSFSANGSAMKFAAIDYTKSPQLSENPRIYP
jgi:hypothetical protein